ncbi:MAG TPA: cell surface protein SprA, partial [Ignavibacteriaceae bacterium]|nr:cell surface protein SprA [Ignavibacteriaceae bacterium]
MEFEKEGQEPVTDLATPSGTVKLLNAFGLDLVDASGQPNPDNNFDWRPNLTIIPETGEVIFPVLEPFGRDLPGKIADSLRFQDIYDTSKTFAQQQKVKDKWLLTGKYSGEASSVYQLGFNIVENSVRVLLNGRQLTPGTDYIVDYNIGQVTIRNDAALVPGADLKITYEKNDLFQLASKTLLGARGVFDFSDRTKLGFSLLNLNQQSLSDKVRIGEEPLSNTIYGIDAQTGVDLPFVTKALDNIISTREMSSVNVSGEYAYMSPDPNTKKSTIASDQGQSIAYIDDFEGAKKEIPVGVSYTAWKDLSPPDSLSGLSGLTYRQMMNYKGKSIWYTVTPSDVNVKQIWPNKSVAQEDQQATVMDYVFIPDTPGTYNYYPHLSDPTRDWGGIMKPLSSTANNLVDENIEFVEFWARVAETSDSARLYLDLGRISEDVIPNDTLNTEDKPPYNDLIDNGEDVGLDGLTDAQERAKYNSTKSDPSGDNFGFTKTGSKEWQDYFNINGTQGNAILTDIGRFPDTEDLNKNGNLDRANSYFRYEIPLDTNKETNPYIAGGGNTNEHWHLYRVPLKNFFEKIGDPSLTDIESIRFIVTGASKVVHLRLTEFNLTGSQWQKVIPPDDSVMSISVVNLEDNPEYTLPPGVYQERDRTRPDQQI